MQTSSGPTRLLPVLVIFVLPCLFFFVEGSAPQFLKNCCKLGVPSGLGPRTS